MYMNWDSSMSIGHPSIDADHKALLDQINVLVETAFDDNAHGSCVKARTEQLLADLRSAMAELVQSEESLMLQHDYPDVVEHRREHVELLKQFDHFVRQFTASAGASLAHLVRFLREWFDYHEENWDRPFGAWLQEARGRADAEPAVVVPESERRASRDRRGAAPESRFAVWPPLPGFENYRELFHRTPERRPPQGL